MTTFRDEIPDNITKRERVAMGLLIASEYTNDTTHGVYATHEEIRCGPPPDHMTERDRRAMHHFGWHETDQPGYWYIFT